jgi:hypothetical protein
MEVIEKIWRNSRWRLKNTERVVNTAAWSIFIQGCLVLRRLRVLG